MALQDSVQNSGKDIANSTNVSGDNFSEIMAFIFDKFILVVEAGLILACGLLVMHWVKNRFERIEKTHEQQKTAFNVLQKIAVGFVLVISVTLALKTLGLDISILVGVGLLGLSYGLKDIINNYIAGILIFLKSPFKIGDVVRIKHYVGKVEKMEFQSTSLKTFDNRDITLYNSDIMSQSIENFSSYNMRRVELNVKIGYGSDTMVAVDLFDKILRNNKNVLTSPKHSIVFKKFADNSIVIQLKFWVACTSNMLATKSAIAWQIHQAFNEESLFAPYVRGFESGSDFSMTALRKGRLQQFYSQAIFAAVAGNGAVPVGVVPNAAGVTTIEIVDGDEPSLEED